MNLNFSNVVLIGFVLFLSSCIKEGTIWFEVTGTVKNIEGTKVYLRQNGTNVDSTIVTGGKFKLRGNIWDKRICEVLFVSNDRKIGANKKVTSWLHSVELFAEDGRQYEIVANSANAILYNTYEIKTNAENQQEFDAYRKERNLRYKLAKANLARLGRLQSWALRRKDDQTYTAYTDSLRQAENALKKINLKLMHQIVSDKPNSYLSIYLLANMADIGKNLNFYRYILGRLEEPFKSHHDGQRFAKFVNRAIRLETAKDQINLKLEAFDAANQPFKYEQFADAKLLVIDFWATWCAPCLKEMPAALKTEQQLLPKGVAYIFMSYDAHRQNWQTQSKQLGLKNTYQLTERAKSYLEETLAITSIPRYVVLNKNGDVLLADAPSPSSSNFMEMIEQIAKTNKESGE